MDPYPRGSDWMPITPKMGSLFHADLHRSSGTTQFIPAIGWPAMVVVILMSGVCLRIELVRADSALIPTLGLVRLILRRASSWRSVPRAIARPARKGRRRGHFTV